MHLAVDLGCKHQVLMLILLQQASIHVMVSNDGHHTMKAYRGKAICILDFSTHWPLTLGERAPDIHWRGSWVGLRASLRHDSKEKTLRTYS
jgi:hypothetical protein